MPKVSIITPLYNGEASIAECLKSVQAQTFGDYEHIIIDNRSSDDGVKIVQTMAKFDSRIKLLANENSRGAGPTRNIGISAASGQYIAFLDCDDAWKKDKLQIQLQKMQGLGLALSWTDYAIIDEHGKYVRTQKASENASYRSVLHKKTVIGCLTAMYDVSILGKRYMQDLPMRQDFCLWLEIIKYADAHNLNYGGIREILSVYRLGGMTKSKSKVAIYQWHVYRQNLSLTRFQTVMAFTNYGLNGLVNRIPKFMQND